MLANFHTHTTFCDGKNTPEEVVLTAIDKGFDAIGFSSHAHTNFDTSYCLTDTIGYVNEINNLKEKYNNKIQIYLGVEEDCNFLVDRKQFDYIIGSSHYIKMNNIYYPIDLSCDAFLKCLKAFDFNIELFAENYYKNFCDYILSAKPDIIGHFDIITKFDEISEISLLSNPKYNEIAEKYIEKAIKSECIFEINTGAIARGYRKFPYPSENLLYILRKNDAKIILSSDCHNAKALDFYFDETKEILKDIGFKDAYALYNKSFMKYSL